MAKIYAPNREYTGVSASVSFVAGVGECDVPNLLDWFRASGYEIRGETVLDGDKPLDKDKMNKDELLAIAAKEGITVSENATKAEIVELIKAARAQ